MRVLIACEMSGITREAFRARGHYALSCDILPTLIPGEHYLGDVSDLLLPNAWDLMIAYPPCTHLATSGAAHFAKKQADGRQTAALDFVRLLLNAPIPRIALENPVSIISSHIRKPDQLIQPYDFGHPYRKRTCLWLKGLPHLESTDEVPDHLINTSLRSWFDKVPPGVDRSVHRSMTWSGIATAMAEQWG